MSWSSDWAFADKKRWIKHFDQSFTQFKRDTGIQPIEPGGNLDLDPIETQLHKLLGTREGKMLEVGCGAGHLTMALLVRKRDIVGCDVSPSAIEHAKKHLAGDYANRFFVSAAEDLKDRTYSTVVAHNLLPQVRDPGKVLETLWALVEDGGSLVLTAPIEKRLGDDPDQIHFFSQDGFKRLVQRVTGSAKSKGTALNGRVSLVMAEKVEVPLRYTQLGMHKDDCRAAIESMSSDALKTGFWNWQRVFNGDMRTMKQIDYGELDVIHVQLAGATMNAVRRVAEEKPDHVQLVAQIDYSIETWNNLAQDMELCLSSLKLADKIIAVEPHSAALLADLTGRDVHLIPHPYPVELIRMAKVPVEARFGLEIATHRDQDWATPYWIARDYPDTFLTGWDDMPTGPNFVALTRLYYDDVLPIVSGDEHVRFMAMRWAVMEAYRHHVFSRTAAECAALGVPCVGYDNAWGIKYLFPTLSVPTGDILGIKRKLDDLADPVRYSQVCQYAEHMVQDLDLEPSGQRFLNVLNDVVTPNPGELDVYPGQVFRGKDACPRFEVGCAVGFAQGAVGDLASSIPDEQPLRGAGDDHDGAESRQELSTAG